MHDIILSPILIIFFLLVGAQISFSDFYDPFPILAFIYLIARTAGKFGGIYFSSDFAGADTVTKQNLGLGLFPQGGVALGLTAIANDILHEAGEAALGELILLTIVVSTVFSEAIGAITTTLALKRADEVGKGSHILEEFDVEPVIDGD